MAEETLAACVRSTSVTSSYVALRCLLVGCSITSVSILKLMPVLRDSNYMTAAINKHASIMQQLCELCPFVAFV